LRHALIICSALTLSALGLPGSAGAAPDGSQVVTALVYHAGSSGPVADSSSLASLQAGCPSYAGPNIELYTSGGQAPTDEVNLGAAWSIGTLLSCLPTPIPLAAVTGVTMLGPRGPQLSVGGDQAQLTPTDLASPSDFANPAESPLVYSDGDGLVYDRPWRGGGDANATDQLIVNAPSPLVLQVFEGPLLTVAATASDASPPPDRPVTFHAIVNGAPPAAALSYSWSFDGGAASATGPSPTVSFPSAGTYNVTVEVSDSAGGGGGATVRVTVGHPASTTSQASGPRSGPSVGPRSRAPSPGLERPPRGNARTPATHRPPARTSLQRAGAVGHASAGSSGSGGGTAARGPLPATSRRPAAGPSHVSGRRTAVHARRPRPRQPAGTGSVRVAGRLIGAPDSLSNSRSGRIKSAAVESSAAVPATGGSAAAAGIVSGAAGLLLFGLGAWSELRGYLRRRPRRTRA
jgi:hypothetical protein